MACQLAEEMKIKYYELVGRYSRKRTQHALLREQWVKMMVEKVITAKASRTDVKKLPKATRTILANYDVIEVDKKPTLVKKQKGLTVDKHKKPKIVISLEHTFEIVLNAHLCTRHGNTNDMYNWIDKCNFYIAPMCAPILREVCLSMNKDCRTGIVKGLYILPITGDAPLSVKLPEKNTASVTILDMTSQPDNSYQCLLIYKDLETKFVQLRPMIAANLIEEISMELMKIFCDFSPPKAIAVETEMINIFASVLERLNKLFPKNINLIVADDDGKGLDSQVETRLSCWMTVKSSTSWSIGCHYVQWDLNSPTHSKHKDGSPFEKFFGIKKFEDTAVVKKKKKTKKEKEHELKRSIKATESKNSQTSQIASQNEFQMSKMISQNDSQASKLPSQHMAQMSNILSQNYTQTPMIPSQNKAQMFIVNTTVNTTPMSIIVAQYPNVANSASQYTIPDTSGISTRESVIQKNLTNNHPNITVQNSSTCIIPDAMREVNSTISNIENPTKSNATDSTRPVKYPTISSIQSSTEEQNGLIKSEGFDVTEIITIEDSDVIDPIQYVNPTKSNVKSSTTLNARNPILHNILVCDPIAPVKDSTISNNRNSTTSVKNATTSNVQSSTKTNVKISTIVNDRNSTTSVKDSTIQNSNEKLMVSKTYEQMQEKESDVRTLPIKKEGIPMMMETIYFCCICELAIVTAVYFCCKCQKSLHEFCGVTMQSANSIIENVCFTCL